MDLGWVEVRVIWAPGYSTHSPCYFETDNRILFLGEAGGRLDPVSGAITPISPPPYNPIDAMDNQDKLMGFEPEILCYGHFGYTNIGVENLIRFKSQIPLWLKLTRRGVE